MISIESLTIKEFRGVRDLTINLGSKSYGICGPNGTGKSGVVDALEFVLTGNVSRLSGEGRGDISLKQHGAHVDKRNNPEKATVLLTAKIPQLNKTVTLERAVKNPNVVTITPSDPDAVRLLKTIADHPEIVLSRRELIRYVLATPGKRAEEVQALLHLDQIEKVRGGLQKIANSCERGLPQLEGFGNEARHSLLRALNVTQLTGDKVLTATNAQRTVLGLAELKELTDKTSLRDGLATPLSGQAQPISKAQAQADVKALRESLAELSATKTAELGAAIVHDLQNLMGDPMIAQSVKLEGFLASGLELALGESCPFCETPWNLTELKNRVLAKVASLKEAARRRAELEARLTPLTNLIRRISAGLRGLHRNAALPKQPIAMPLSNKYAANLDKTADRLASILPLEETIAVLGDIAKVPDGVVNEIETFEKYVAALPDPSKQDAAREWLTVAQERLETYRTAMRKLKIAKEQGALARKISDIYAATSDSVLTGIYDAVQKDFASLYAFINRSDEKDFKAKLTPSMGKLGFDVDFYGRGFFPPGAYHSEGHQDGMGLCLYLALMRHLHGKAFTLAILDDVLMSVDSGHRREVCTLLKKEFPNTQFIMTTHDPIWLRHMRTEGLISTRASLQFRKWTVDTGPTQWDDRDIWTEIGQSLDENDVRGAASLLRHYLEYTAAEICHHLRASVEFRGDAQYQLGELMPSAIGCLRKLYGRGKEAANSWGQKDKVTALNQQGDKFDALADASNVEQWQVNSAIHFNNWENLGKNDFEPVANTFKSLLAGFSCPACDQYMRVSPERESIEALRCDCGTTNINLKKK